MKPKQTKLDLFFRILNLISLILMLSGFIYLIYFLTMTAITFYTSLGVQYPDMIPIIGNILNDLEKTIFVIGIGFIGLSITSIYLVYKILKCKKKKTNKKEKQEKP